MTLEELKEEAKKQGYYLTKKVSIPNMLPCKCGCKIRRHWWNGKTRERGLQCTHCGVMAWGKDRVDVINEWNKFVKEMT